MLVGGPRRGPQLTTNFGGANYNGTENHWLHQAADPRRQGNSGTARRPRSRPEGRSFSFITKTPPAPVLIKKAAGIETASGVPNKNKVGSITLAQAEEIAKQKMPDLNAASLEAAVSMIKGTCRSMGVTVEE